MAPVFDRIAAFFKSKKADTYEYLPLDEEASQIWLLTLRPGKFSARIHVDLHTERLTTERRPRYEPLSCLKHNPKSRRYICLTVYPVQRCHQIKSSSCTAVSPLSGQGKGSLGWCYMHQSEKSARTWSSSQTNGQYLFNSKRVIIWWGKEGDNSTIALQTLERLSTKIEVS